MKKSVLVASAMAVAMAWAAAAQGPGPGRGPQAGPGGAPCPMHRGMPGVAARCDQPGGLGGGLMFLIRNPRLAEKVGLTADDVQKLREQAFAHGKQMIALRAEAEKARLELEELKSSSGADGTAVEKAIERVHAVEAEIEKAQYRHQREVRSIISEERLEDLWQSARELREKRWEERKGRRAERGGAEKGVHPRRFGKWRAGAAKERAAAQEPGDKVGETDRN